MKAHIYRPFPPEMEKGALYLGEPSKENLLAAVDATEKSFKTFVKTGKTSAEYYNRILKPKKKKEEPNKAIIPVSIAEMIVEGTTKIITETKNGKDIKC